MIKNSVQRKALREEARPVCWVSGPAVQVRELAVIMRERARAGEIEILGPIRRHPRLPDVVLQPYVLRKPRRRIRKTYLFVGAGAVYALTCLALLWEARFFFMQVVGGLLAVASVAWLLTRARHSGACPGLHCSGCRG